MEHSGESEVTTLPTAEYHLILYSHGRSPPLHPPPDLRYDIRSIPNPPKALRDASDGRSKRLREHLLSEPKFVEKLKDVERDIRTAMRSKVEEWEQRMSQQTTLSKETGKSVSSGNAKGQGTPPRRGPATTCEDNESSTTEEEYGGDEEDDDGNDGGDGDDTENDDESESEDVITLRVGCNCALGHHRSVAFVHELAQLPWPKDWQVEAIHRDLDVKRASGTRERQKANFRRQGKVYSERRDE